LLVGCFFANKILGDLERPLGCSVICFANRSMLFIGCAYSFCCMITVALEPIGKYFSISKYLAFTAKLLY
jgi:hypothetical protein